MQTSQPVRATQHWSILVFLFALANFLEVGVMAHFVLFTPTFFNTIGFGAEEINAWTGPAASLSFLLGIWFVPFWGVLADRYGRKPLILRSYYVDIAAMVIAALSRNIWLYLFGRALTGLALGNTGLMYASLTETAPRNRVALSLSLVNGSAPLGGLVGALVGGWIVTQFGVHTLFWMDAGVAFVIALLLTLFYHETFVPKETPPIGVMLGDALQAVIQSPVATTIFLVSFVYNSAFFFSYTYLPVRIGEMVGERDAPAVIGLTQGVAGVATLIGSAVWGGLADRIGHRRLLIALMAAATVLWLPIYTVQDAAGLAAGWALFNAISPAVTSLMITIISLNVTTERRGAVLSMIYLPLNVAFVVAPFSASFVARNLEVRDVFLVSSGLAFLALLIFTLNLGRTRGEQNVATGK